MTADSIADFYAQTEEGQVLIARGRAAGREEGREEAVADVLRERFGRAPGIDDLATRLVAELGYPAALRAVLAVESLDDL